VAAGQGTVAVELLEQAGTLDAVFVAVGGGGLISGIGSWLALRAPRARVIAVSPRNSAVMHASMAAGRLLDLPSLPTLSDATAGGVEAGAITFELCREVVDRSLLVDEEPIAQAIRWMIDSHHMLIEGAAALAVAGLRQLAPELQGARVAVVLCGANIGSARLSKVLCPQGQSAPLS
jgi:threonine dehydratase